MTISFAPLRPDAVDYLGFHTGVDYSYGGSFAPPNWFCVTARNDEGQLMGVLACEFKTWFEVQFSTAITDPHCMSRRLLKAIFTALFSQARRITAEVAIDNGPALNRVLRMGFVLEGYCRLGINGVKDAYTFGMLKEDCAVLSNARPASPRSHIPDSVVRNIESLSQRSGRVSRPPDLDDLISRESGIGSEIRPTGGTSAGADLVTHVLLPSRPADMPLVETRSARARRRVSSFLALWLGTIGALTHPPVDSVHFRATATMAATDHTVAELIGGERPQDAFIGFGDESLFEKALSGTISSHAFSLNPNRSL